MLDDARRRGRAEAGGACSSCRRSNIIGPSAASMPKPASSTTTPLTSVDLATVPFLRASSRFFGVAFSVFSPAAGAHLAHPQRAERGLDRALELRR